MKTNENERYLKTQETLRSLGFEIDLIAFDDKNREALYKLCEEHNRLKSAKKTVSEQDPNASPFAEGTEMNNSFRAIVEQSFECVSIADLEGNYVYVNDAFCSLMGYSKDEVLSRTVFDMKENPTETDIFRAAKNGSTVGEIFLKRKDGTTFLCSIRGKSIEVRERQFILGILTDMTEKVAAEGALQDANDRIISVKETLELAVNGSHAGIWDWTETSKHKIWWSPQFYRLLGYEPNEIEGDLTIFREMVHPTQVEGVVNLVNIHLKKRTPYDAEVMLRTKTGAYKWFRSSGIATYDEDGKPKRMVGSIIDINDRKVAEQKNKHYQYLLEKSQEIGQIGTWEYDFRNKEMTWTKEVYEMAEMEFGIPVKFGYFLKMTHPKDRAFSEKTWYKAVTEKKLYDIEHRLLINDKVKWARIKATFFYGEDGQLERAIGLIQDISKRKKAYKEIEDLKHALDEFSIVVVTDKEGTILSVNEKFCEISKYTEDELIGQTHKIVSSDYHPKAFWKNLWDTITSGHIWSGEVKNKAKDGTCYWVSMSVIPFLDDNGEPFQFIAIRTEINAQKQLEKDLRKAKSEADENAKVKEMFLANMSHEIRTPMNGVLGFSNLLLQTKLNEAQQEYVQSIHCSAENLLMVINDILDVSKMESGKFQINNIEFNLQSKIESTLQILQIAVREKDLYLNLNFDPKIPSCLIGAPNRIAQVLINLIGNAIKFTDKGGVDLKVYLVEDKIKFDVIDTGIGIPEEKLDVIFESFTQVESYTTREYGGTGLGLTICKQLVELMEGDIDVETKVNVGTTFSFTIPVRTCSKAMKETNEGQEWITIPDSWKILVAEDNLVNQKLVKHYLKKMGCTYNMVENGLEVLDQNLEAYSLILMDIQMPKMDGLEATKKIREQHNKIPIVAMTAHALEKEKQRCLNNGMDDYLTKPFKIDELKSILYKFYQMNK
ncbi:MAG: PAS domain S-box protein [Aureispira sp.]|nr:PAS domain S-box protein [Aureispira sp.]